MPDKGEGVMSDAVAPRMVIGPSQAHVWCAWTASCDQPDLLESYRALLNEAERARLERFAFDYLKLEYLVTRALCRTTLSHYASVAPTDWRFRLNQYGRPEIDMPGWQTNLRFNLSNARSLVSCVVTRDVDVGVDVEELDRRSETVAIADHYFSPSEVEALRELPLPQQRQRFFEYWTLKESYIKARGMGLSIPLEQFSFHLDGGPIRITFDKAIRDDPAHWQFLLHRPSERHLLAVGIDHKGMGSFRVDFRETVPLGEMERSGVTVSDQRPACGPR
jgi:4'-phosphopantetheinyl transferase